MITLSKKIIVFAVVVGLFSLSASSQTKTPADTSSVPVLGKIWSKVTGLFSPADQDIAGKWNYQGTACLFETDNLLKKAGGAVVANKVEKQFNDYCRKVGIKEGKSDFVFNADSTYSAKLGLARLKGKYSIDKETNLITMSYMLGMGKLRATPVQSGNNLKLMFEADGFLKMMKTLSMFTKDNSIEILAAMADMYDGMLLGFDLDREKEK
ncbi:MAG: DUF4923 family protein [Petrimonas sp.]|nr:DUF4923 family protein [Petrimonas sp.]